jgi:predicted amidohydrolase
MKHRVAALQMTPGWQPDAAGLARRLRPLVGRAAEEGAELVALPALVGWATAAARLGIPAGAPYGLEALAALDLGGSEARRALEGAAEEALGACREAASACGVWLVGGSMPQAGEDGALYNAAPVVSPQGELCGWQRETHVARAGRAFGLARGGELTMIDTAVGRLGLLLGEDVLYPEAARFLCLLGADILVHQGAWRSASQGEWMSRLWREVQANQVFGLESVLAGGGFRGRATVHAPLEMTPARDGVLAQAAAQEGDEVLTAELDDEARWAVIEHFPIYDSLNEALYRRYFPALYERGRQ